MKIHESRFCGLSRAKDFQAFLKNVDAELHQKLLNHLQLNEGCKSNSKKMKNIYAEIKSRGKEQQLIDFMMDRYPHMVIRGKSQHTEVKPNRSEKNTKVKKLTAATPNQLYEKMNYHGVFDIYRPKVFFVPQRKIIVGPTRKHVTNSITRFSAGKLDVDYLVLQGPELWHGYVEYFEPRFKDQISKVDHSQRPIAKYRRLNKP